MDAIDIPSTITAPLNNNPDKTIEYHLYAIVIHSVIIIFSLTNNHLIGYIIVIWTLLLSMQNG